MKLRNFAYAAMLATVFASCSKDDENIPGTDGDQGDVTLSMKVSAPVSTKAISSETVGDLDTKISTLTTYVFDTQSNILEAVGNKVSDTESKTEKIKAGTKKVIVLANIEPAVILGTTTYDEFIAKTSNNLANEKNGKLSMNSQAFDIVLKAGVVNYLGYDDADIPAGGNKVLNTSNQVVSSTPVKLYRNVAKVVLNKINLLETNKNRYPNGKLNIENVYILNARSTTKIVGADAKAWGATMSTTSEYVNGMSGTDYAAWVGVFEAITKPALFSYLTGNYATAVFADYVGVPSIELSYGQGSTGSNAVDQFYVYENIRPETSEKGTDANTLLVVKAKFTYDGNPNPESRYYTVAVGHTGTDAVVIPDNFGMTNADYQAKSGRTALSGVLRNFQYNITLNISGPGYTTPVGPKPEDDTFLQAKVEVVPFGQVNQSTDIE